MANEALAPAAASPPGAPSEDEYQTFCAALSASGRGRSFLAEYGRRNRGADTKVLLAALARLESVIRLQHAGAEPMRAELRTLLGVIRAARPETDGAALPTRAAKLAQLLDLLERRIATLAEEEQALPGEAQLAVVPLAEEPELPIPSPSATPPALTIAHDRTPPHATQPAPEITAMLIVPEVAWLDSPPPGVIEQLDEPVAAEPAPPTTLVEKVAARAVQPVDAPPPPETAKAFEPLFTEVPPPKNDPLRPLMLLSEYERLALFT